jgi:hypothetical protein
MIDLKETQRHVLLASIAKARELEYNAESTDYNQTAKELLGVTATATDTESVESILNFIKKLPKYEDLVKEAREQGMDIPKVESIEVYQTGTIGWMRRMLDIIA